MANVEFEDYSIDVKAALDDAAIAWLIEVASEVESHAKRNCKMDGEMGTRLRGSYQNVVDDEKGEATIGSPMEAVYWEEFGTGEHAAHHDGRKGWWVYVKDGGVYHKGGESYSSEAEAQAIADSMRADGLDAYATNGRDPQYTLQKAFDANRKKAENVLINLLKEKMK